MPYNELIQLYFERSDAIQSYWTLYVAVIGGVLAFASLRQRPDWLTTTLVSILFAVFAYKNLGGIYDATIQRYAILDLIRKAPAPAEENPITPTLLPPDYPGVRNYHIAVDALTILTLWAMERRRRRSSPPAAGQERASVLA